MQQSRIPDAVRSPAGFAGAGDSFMRLFKLQAEFSPALNAKTVFVRLQGNEHFISRHQSDTLHFVNHGPQAGKPRYVWEDRGDGVHYGYLKADC